mmetsp:Transcript_6214/g.15243  ORF Transcript_6214/g.15243 Transcript_6214/m.15243 type:complete len:110 (+) Transcript_6214:467-796(+)
MMPAAGSAGKGRQKGLGAEAGGISIMMQSSSALAHASIRSCRDMPAGMPGMPGPRMKREAGRTHENISRAHAAMQGKAAKPIVARALEKGRRTRMDGSSAALHAIGLDR